MASNTSKRTYGQKTLTEGMQAVPTGLTNFSTTDSWIFQLTVSNTTGGALTLLVEDRQASPQAVVPTISIPANTIIIMEWEEGVKMIKGIQWQAGGSGLTAEIFGFSV